MVDAKGKAPGRLASEIAKLLIGKHRVDYQPHMDVGDFVEVENVGEMKITGDKLKGKMYYRHSGHPGGLKTEQMKHVFERDPGEVLRRAVLRMVPGNRLRKDRMKRLKIK